MTLVQNVLTIFFVVTGLFFMLVAAIGIWRMPDLYLRMHAASKASTLGISGIALAALFYLGDYTTTIRVILIISFFFLTTPVGIHALASAAYITGAELWSQTRRFELAKARILCPVRGGPASQKLYTKAIQLARENRAELTFLYVINRELVEVAGQPSEAIGVLSELRTLGQSVLATAQQQARAQGVIARGEVRVGELASELVQMANSIEATLVMLGYPTLDRAADQKAAEDQVWDLVSKVQAESSATVQVVR